MDQNSNSLELARPENLQLITSNAPQAYNESVISHDRCIAAGQSLIDQVSQSGMSDDLDQQIALFIEKSRKTVAKINTSRTPFTRLFDAFKSQFTALENDIDPTKRDTIPFRLQQYRNQYAAQKRQEEERRRSEAILQQQIEAARKQFRLDVTQFYTAAANEVINSTTNRITQLFLSVTLDNYALNQRLISEAPEQLSDTLITDRRLTVTVPLNLDRAECVKTASDICQQLLPSFRHSYTEQIVAVKTDLLTALPSRQQELQRAAQASAEEAERIRQKLAERDAAQQAERQAQQQADADRQQQQLQLQQQQADALAAFGTTAAATAIPSGYQPKTSVKKKIQVLSPDGIQQIINFWWVNEGQHLPLDELTKIFKKQITFAERAANDKLNGPQLITSPSITYTDDVKAK